MQTIDCPQIGGKMFDVTETERSPLFGIETWTKCASVCQYQPDCQHWQWNSTTEECKSVIEFSGFTAEENVYTGARNCPITAQSLLSLCPTNGPGSFMWRETTPTNDAFYDPQFRLEPL